VIYITDYGCAGRPAAGRRGAAHAVTGEKAAPAAVLRAVRSPSSGGAGSGLRPRFGGAFGAGGRAKSFVHHPFSLCFCGA